MPFDEGHHVVESSIRGAGIEERQDVRMLEVRGDLDEHFVEGAGAERTGESEKNSSRSWNMPSRSHSFEGKFDGV